MPHSERAAYRDPHPQSQLRVRLPSTTVDHDAVTGKVRGAVFRNCNSWLGPWRRCCTVPRRRPTCTGGSRAR
ncbi:endonuclease domain-containing protein [Streptomyces murinus]|uniref:endonuclease domain-containing protein n=1 Tax=Streptomyces murinus TaxID=33900 RepID=UPI0038019B14